MIDLGFLLNEVAGGGGQHEVAVSVGVDTVHAVVGEFDAVGVGSGGDDEVVFELALVAVEDHVHAGVDFRAFQLRVLRDVGDPLLGVIADEVIADAGKLFEGFILGALRVDGAHADDGGWH